MLCKFCRLVALSEPTAKTENIPTHGSNRKHKRKKRPKTAKANRYLITLYLDYAITLTA